MGRYDEYEIKIDSLKEKVKSLENAIKNLQHTDVEFNSRVDKLEAMNKNIDSRMNDIAETAISAENTADIAKELSDFLITTNKDEFKVSIKATDFDLYKPYYTEIQYVYERKIHLCVIEGGAKFLKSRNLNERYSLLYFEKYNKTMVFKLDRKYDCAIDVTEFIRQKQKDSGVCED